MKISQKVLGGLLFFDSHCSFGHACLSVCMSLCETVTFESLDIGKFIFAHAVYLHGLQVKFVYEGHRVKVTEAKKVQNPYSCNT